MRRADIEVPNGAVDVNSWAPSACYPQGSFYPLSDTPSTRRYQITKPDFRLCSTCKSRSQAPLCLCTLRLVSIQPEGTVGRLRYPLGGDRPSQTAHQPRSPTRLTAPGERHAPGSAGCDPPGRPPTPPPAPTRPPPPPPPPPRGRPPRLPPILRKPARAAMASCSKAPWG